MRRRRTPADSGSTNKSSGGTYTPTLISKIMIEVQEARRPILMLLMLPLLLLPLRLLLLLLRLLLVLLLLRRRRRRRRRPRLLLLLLLLLLPTLQRALRCAREPSTAPPTRHLTPTRPTRPPRE